MAKHAAPLLADDDFDGGNSSEWFARNAAWITTLLGVTALGFAGWYLYHGFNRAKNEDATAVFSKAYLAVETAVGETETTARLTKLKEASLQAIKASDELGSHPLGAHSLLVAGNGLFESAYGQSREEAVSTLNEALKVYDRYITVASTDKQRAVGNLARANTLDNIAFLTGDVQKATEASKAYTTAATLGRGTAVDLEARLGSGRLLLAQPGREVEATRIIESVVKDSRSMADSGLTKTLRDLSPVTTHTVRTQTQSFEMSQADVENLRRLEYMTLGGIASELLERVPALTTETTGTKAGS